MLVSSFPTEESVKNKDVRIKQTGALVDSMNPFDVNSVILCKMFPPILLFQLLRNYDDGLKRTEYADEGFR